MPPAGRELPEPSIDQLSQQQRRDIYAELGFSEAPDGRGLIAGDCGPVEFRAEIVDLNEDGTSEVMLVAGNACTSGNTGTSVHLFMADSTGRYSHQLGFPAAGYRALANKGDGFPDLAFTGPGFCHGVWRAYGGRYQYECSIEAEQGACDARNVETICEQGVLP